LEVEHDEEDGDEVVAHIELHAAVLERLEAALVRRELVAVVGIAGEESSDAGAERQEYQRESSRDDEKNQYRQIIGQHASVARTKGASAGPARPVRDPLPLEAAHCSSTRNCLLGPSWARPAIAGPTRPA